MKIYDFAAIGIGPFNLGLACLTTPIEGLEGIFLDKRESFDWHPGMMMENTTLQIPFLADLVTLADPTSKFSFLNYIKEQGRIYSFYIRENFLLLRKEYNQYCKWAISKLPNLRFNTDVQSVTYNDQMQCYEVHALCVTTGEDKVYRARKLVLGTGTSPHVPACCNEVMGQAIHSAFYLNHKRKLQNKKSITVVGSGQSAAEIFYDLLQEIDVHGYELHWLTRSTRFFPLEYSKLTLEMTSPDYVDYFYNLPSGQRDQLVKDQQNLYKGINDNLIADIYDLIYTKNLNHKVKVGLRTNTEVTQAAFDAGHNSFELIAHQHEVDQYFRHNTEGLVLATGYAYRLPGFIDGIQERIQWDAQGRYDVNRNYSIDTQAAEIFVQNAELHTHGFVTPDLGMACYRNSHIIRSITGYDYYPIEQRIAFQQFGVTEEERIHSPLIPAGKL